MQCSLPEALDNDLGDRESKRDFDDLFMHLVRSEIMQTKNEKEMRAEANLGLDRHYLQKILFRHSLEGTSARESASYLESMPVEKMKSEIQNMKLVILRKEIDFFHNRSSLFGDNIIVHASNAKFNQDTAYSRYYLASRLLIEKENQPSTAVTKLLGAAQDSTNWSKGEVQRCLREFKHQDLLLENVGTIKAISALSWLDCIDAVSDNIDSRMPLTRP